MGRIIEVVPHDSTVWRDAFAREASALEQVFGEALVAIHHVGSTSIPGLPAKPIIDLLVVLRETSTIGRFSSAMEALAIAIVESASTRRLQVPVGAFTSVRTRVRNGRTRHTCAP